MCTILYAPVPHKIAVCVTEATFVTEYISTVIMYVSEIVLEFLLDVREIELNEACQHNRCNVCGGCRGKYTKVSMNDRKPVFLSVLVFLFVTPS